jgi:Tetratricopeptide repeat
MCLCGRVQEPERARIILAKARGEGEARVPASSTQRVWMKSAVVERELGNTAEERRLLRAALERFPYFDKLWLMLGQLEQRGGAVAAARLAYQNGLKRCISSVPLWRVRRSWSGCVLVCPAQWCSPLPPGCAAGAASACSLFSSPLPLASAKSPTDVPVQAAARLEEQAGNMSKARAILEQGRHKNKGNEELWLISVRTELRAGLPKAADSLMAKALQVRAQPLGQQRASMHRLQCFATPLWRCAVQAVWCACTHDGVLCPAAGVPHVRHAACGGHQHGAPPAAACKVCRCPEALQRRPAHHRSRRPAVLARPQGESLAKVLSWCVVVCMQLATKSGVFLLY